MRISNLTVGTTSGRDNVQVILRVITPQELIPIPAHVSPYYPFGNVTITFFSPHLHQGRQPGLLLFSYAPLTPHLFLEWMLREWRHRSGSVPSPRMRRWATPDGSIAQTNGTDSRHKEERKFNVKFANNAIVNTRMQQLNFTTVS